jgi:phosphonate transport system ATP-binding protein
VAQLDPASAERVLSLLKTTTQSEGAATLCSLHQVELARAFADRVIGLRDGCVVFDGPPWDLTARALAEIYGRGDDRAVTTPWPKPLTPA